MQAHFNWDNVQTTTFFGKQRIAICGKKKNRDITSYSVHRPKKLHERLLRLWRPAVLRLLDQTDCF